MSTRFLSLVFACLLFVSLPPAFRAHAAGSQSQAQQAASPEETVLIGLGQREISQGSALSFTPKYIDVTVGDTILFKDVDALEPHTVTFGPMVLLKHLIDHFITPLPHKNGPPTLALDARVFKPTMGHTYDGTGLANSGFLRAGQSWSLTFTKPGTYTYVCVIHGFTMSGVVIVHPHQPMGKVHIVQAGDGLAARQDKSNATTSDAFYPVQVTVHAGDTVEWIGGFHTVSFGPAALIHRLEQHLFAPVPQKSGPPILAFNPTVAFPSGGARYGGTGYANSGILAFQIPPGSKAPPTYRLTFTRPGTYTYYCLLHPGMDGTIVVTP